MLVDPAARNRCRATRRALCRAKRAAAPPPGDKPVASLGLGGHRWILALCPGPQMSSGEVTACHRGGDAKGCPGAAHPTGSVYSSEGELMQLPSSRHVSGASRAAVGRGLQGLTGNLLPGQPWDAHTRRYAPFTPGVWSPSLGRGAGGWLDPGSCAVFAGRKDVTSCSELLLKLMIYRGLQSAISRLLISPAHNLN